LLPSNSKADLHLKCVLHNSSGTEDSTQLFISIPHDKDWSVTDDKLIFPLKDIFVGRFHTREEAVIDRVTGEMKKNIYLPKTGNIIVDNVPLLAQTGTCNAFDPSQKKF